MLLACGVKINTHDDTARIYAGCSSAGGVRKVQRRENATFEQKTVSHVGLIIVFTNTIALKVTSSNKGKRRTGEINGSECPVIQHVSMPYSAGIRVIPKDCTGRTNSGSVAADCAGRIETCKVAALGDHKTMESTIYA